MCLISPESGKQKRGFHTGPLWCRFVIVKSFDTVDRGILARVLSSLGLPAWFRHAYFEYHSQVRLRFKLAAGLGQPWTRDGGYPPGLSSEYDVYCCSLSSLV